MGMYYKTFCSHYCYRIVINGKHSSLLQYGQGDQMIFKIGQLKKIAKTASKPKNAKISTSNHFWNLKIPTTNHALKLLYLGENVINFLKQKVAKYVAIALGYHFLNHNELPKVAQLAKNRPICSPWIRQQLRP